MRLISQDGMIDVPYEQAIIEYEACERNGEDVFHIIFARTTRNTFPIARYSTEAKAIKAMEMLREQYMRNNALYIDRENNARVIPQNSLFKFPDDSEVEV